MGKIVGKIILMFMILGSFLLVPLMTADVEALEPKLLWKREFKQKVKNVDLAAETGDVILSLENRGEIILFDKDGNKRFHWGPRMDRRAGGARIARDGKYFAFYSGYRKQVSLMTILLEEVINES
jgi:hypothetical protein